jgi:hypothetical protein
MKAELMIAQGALIGWCTRCGSEEFNGTRHVCRKPNKDAADLIATKQENQRLRAELDRICIDYKKLSQEAEELRALTGRDDKRES